MDCATYCRRADVQVGDDRADSVGWHHFRRRSNVVLATGSTWIFSTPRHSSSQREAERGDTREFLPDQPENEASCPEHMRRTEAAGTRTSDTKLLLRVLHTSAHAHTMFHGHRCPWQPGNTRTLRQVSPELSGRR